WTDHAARAAPLCPEIDENGLARAEDRGVEIAVGDGVRLHRVILALMVAKIKGGEKAASSGVPCEALGADRHQTRAFGPQERAADLMPGIDLGERRAVEGELAQ